MIRKVALTGTIGSGKSTVAELFRKQGVSTLSVDAICKKLNEPYNKGWWALKREFGSKYFNTTLDVARHELRTAMFNSNPLRRKINSMFHLLLKEALDEAYKNISEPIVIVEVPLLFESGWQKDFDSSICVFADNEICLDRIVTRDNVTRNNAQAIVDVQMSPEEKMRLADHVVFNSFGIEGTAKQVEKILNKLKVCHV